MSSVDVCSSVTGGLCVLARLIRFFFFCTLHSVAPHFQLFILVLYKKYHKIHTTLSISVFERNREIFLTNLSLL